MDDPSDLESIYVRAAGDGESGDRMVPLSSFVTMTERAVAPELRREGQRRAVPMNATLAPGVDLRQGMDHLEVLAERRLDTCGRFGSAITYAPGWPRGTLRS